MRPLLIGGTPLNPDGTPVQFKEYQEAKPHLLERIGIYCVFCERKIPSGLAVEHKKPKTLYLNLQTEWSNFVIACFECNSTKGKKDTGITPHLFPDEVNTAYAFAYKNTNEVIPNPDLSVDEQQAAGRTLSLVGLDKRDFRPDSRFMQRGQAWEKAKQCLKYADKPEMWELIINFAEAEGFWSVWMAVFADHAELRKMLIRRFVGTNIACFDGEGNCRPHLNV